VPDITTQIMYLEVVHALLQSIADKVNRDSRYNECKLFVENEISPSNIVDLIEHYGSQPIGLLFVPRCFSIILLIYKFNAALSSIWSIVTQLPISYKDDLLEDLINQLIHMDHKSNKRQFDSMLLCLDHWNEIPALIMKVVEVLQSFQANLLGNL